MITTSTLQVGSTSFERLNLIGGNRLDEMRVMPNEQGIKKDCSEVTSNENQTVIKCSYGNQVIFHKRKLSLHGKTKISAENLSTFSLWRKKKISEIKKFKKNKKKKIRCNISGISRTKAMKMILLTRMTHCSVNFLRKQVLESKMIKSNFFYKAIYENWFRNRLIIIDSSFFAFINFVFILK